MLNLAILGSGGGSNAQAIIDHFEGSTLARVALVVSNSPGAYILERAQRAGIPTRCLASEAERSASNQLALYRTHSIHLIVLAGYLRKVPKGVIQAYPGRILNIHPSLLPKFGGKGMHGLHVHEAVLAAVETHTGITIHYVNEEYDQGEILHQHKLAIEPGWDAQRLQQEVQKLEHTYYPKIVQQVCEEIVAAQPNFALS